MKINAVNGTNQPAFQKVNQKYLKWAEFKDISSKDGVDTMNAARKYVTEPSMKFFNHVMDCIKRA